MVVKSVEAFVTKDVQLAQGSLAAIEYLKANPEVAEKIVGEVRKAA